MVWSLVFYFLFTGCMEKKDRGSVSIRWEGNKAVAIIVPQQFLSSVSKDSVNKLLHIHLAESDTPIMGDYSFDNETVIFKPIIAFTRGLKYKVYVRNKLVDEIEIRPPGATASPEVIAVYPALDTLPENLLKFYISFSKRMQEGDALSHIYLIKDGHDTLSSVFLDLQPELWNSEGTTLTLWLDPGRIKRGLQPNKLLGPPLSKGSHYQLTIQEDWRDAEGMLLTRKLTKNFFSGPHDSISPNEQGWTIETPRPGTKEQLMIRFHESLDHVLAENALSVVDAKGTATKGRFRVNNYGTIAYFFPDIEWKPGIYILQIESRLEDLAGNNLDRLFDTDVTQRQQASKEKHNRQFEIR